MRSFGRIAAAAVLMTSLGVPAAAQQAPAAASQIGTSQMPPQLGTPSGKAMVLTGAGVFVGGMGMAIYGFLNNKNGVYPEFGEATATNVRLGGAGIGMAFAGGALMALGHRLSRHSPDIQVGMDRFAVSKKITW
jgi:hypothetical protein